MAADVPSTRNVNDHIAAVKTALAGIEDFPVWSQETTGQVPEIFCVPHISRRFTDPFEDGSLYGQMLSTGGWLLLLRVTGRTPGGCQWGAAEATKALEGKRLTVASVRTSPLAFQNHDPASRDDDGYYTAAVTWIYSLEDQ